MFNVYNMNKKSDITVFLKKKKSLLNPILMEKKYDNRSYKCGEPCAKKWRVALKILYKYWTIMYKFQFSRA